MNFSDMLKNIDLSSGTELVVPIHEIKAQYNPTRFKYWKSLHEGEDEEVLNMLYSPHYRLLLGDDKAYFKMHRLYGKNDVWIEGKINKFVKLYKSISKDGIQEKVFILNRPLVSNKYNKGFEIFEGHHRIACCLTLGIEQISAMIIGG